MTDHLDVLQTIADLSGDGGITDTEQLAAALGYIGGGAPWFGQHEVVKKLETEGLLEIDAGMAQFVPPGQPAPTTDRLYLVITDAGRAALEPRNSA